MPDSRGARRGYLDFMRGVAVLIMIEAHVVDSWTGGADRESRRFAWSMILGGLGAPLFLFLAGVSVSLSASAKLRRLGDQGAASRAVVRRGLEIFGLAFLFRLQAWILGWGSPRSLLKVDILNIMGPSIMAAAALWGSVRTPRARAILFAVATAAIAFLTPPIRMAPIAALPDPIEAYIRPIAGLTNFVFFPWSAFVFAGALIGVVLQPVLNSPAERRINVYFAAAGAALALGAFGASFLPSVYSNTYFWTTSPAFFFMRVGIMTLALALAFAWEARPGGLAKWSPVQQLGRTSLFIYWIHVEMVYGLISLPLHHRLTIGQAWAACGLFCIFMLGCSLLKDWVVARNYLDFSRLRGHRALAPKP